MKKYLSVCMIFLCFLILTGCEPGEEDNPIPVLTSLSPDATVAHMPEFTLTVSGSNFVSGSQITFNGVVKTTTFISSTQVSCKIAPAETAFAAPAPQPGDGIASPQDQTVTVLVSNPTPGGGDSGTLNFSIYGNHTFGAAKNLTNNAGNSYYPDIAVDGNGKLFVVWQDNTTGSYKIYLRASNDNGQTWTSPVNISGVSGNMSMPAIAINNSNHVVVVWTSQDSTPPGLWFTRSTDSGTSWSTPVLFINSSAGISTAVDLAIDGSGNFNVTWNYSNGVIDDIAFCRSTDNGVTWISPVNVSSTSGWSWLPKIAVDSSGTLFVVWWDLTSGEEIYFSRSSNNGVTWAPPTNLSNTYVGESTHPQIAVDITGKIYVVWDDEMPHPDELLYFTKSSDTGGSWSTPQSISLHAPYDNGSAIGVDSAVNINVSWKGWGGGTNSEIYFSRSIDNGTSWTYPLNISNLTENSTSNQAMAVDSAGNISVVWQAADREIYFTSSH